MSRKIKLMAVYQTPYDYYMSAQETQDRITRLKTIITNLETCLIKAASNSDVQQYSFNDGQSQINTTYRSIKELTSAIDAFDTILNRLINSSSSRSTILRDASTLPNRYNI